MTTMSFIKKIKKKGKTYAIEVEGYRDKDGKVKHKYLRYLGTLDENGKVKSSQKAITVDKVLRFGLPAIVSRAIEQLKLKDMLEKYKEDQKERKDLCDRGRRIQGQERKSKAQIFAIFRNYG